MSITQAQLGHMLLKSLVSLRQEKRQVHIEDLGAMLEQMASSMTPSSQPEVFIRDEFGKIAQHIEQAKAEILSLLPAEEDSPQHIGHASSQLDAVKEMTEDATNRIMDATDKIQQAVDGNAPDMKDIVGQAAADIYLACNFQDITGQRISKVLTTLEYIETKVRNITALFGQVNLEHLDEMESAPIDLGDESHLLNGPQLADKAKTQEEIDKLFANF